MNVDNYLINMYQKIGNVSSNSYRTFISNAEKSYYELQQSLKNTNDLLYSSKWNDDIKTTIENNFDKFVSITESCSNFVTDVIVPLSEQVELLSKNLTKYYNLTKKNNDYIPSDNYNNLSNITSIDSFYNNIHDWISDFSSFRDLIYKFYDISDRPSINIELNLIYNDIRNRFNNYNKKIYGNNNYNDHRIKYYNNFGYQEIQDREIQNFIRNRIDSSFRRKDQSEIDNYVNLNHNESTLEAYEVAKECYENIKNINKLLGNENVVAAMSSKIDYYSTKVDEYTHKYKKTSGGYITVTTADGKKIVRLADSGKVLSGVVGGLGATAFSRDASDNEDSAVAAVYDFNKEEVDKEDNTNISNVSKIHFIGTGSSDAILIESNGHFGLIDSSNGYNDGTIWSVSDSKESVDHVITYLKNHNVSKLDFIVATHNHCDHIGGMPAISKTFVQTGMPYYYRPYTKTYEDEITDWDNSGYSSRAISAMRSAGANLINVTGTHPLLKIGDFEIQLLNTETLSKGEKKDSGVAASENYNSIVQSVTYKGRHKTLLASDMCYEDEMKVANSVGSVQILKMGHHSFDSSTGIDFVNKITPKYTIITNNSTNDHFAYGSMYYMQTKLGTRIMYTGSNDAIVIDYNDSGYFVTPDSPIPTFSSSDSGNWKTVNGRTKMYYKNGSPVYEWEKIDNKWYYFSHGGDLKTGWQEILYNDNMNWYYFDVNGIMQTGFQNLDWNGSKNWYYFNDDGAMQTGWQELTWKNKKNWYYFNDDGAMQTDWQEIEYKGSKHWFYFNSDGMLQTSWQELTWKGSKHWFYFDNDGVMQTGWQELSWGGSNHWFYFNDDGTMVVSTKKTIDGKEYSFDSNGFCSS